MSFDLKALVVDLELVLDFHWAPCQGGCGCVWGDDVEQASCGVFSWGDENV